MYNNGHPENVNSHACLHAACKLPCSAPASMQQACFHGMFSLPCSVQASIHMAASMQCAGYMECVSLHAVCMLPCSVHASMQCACFHAVCSFRAMRKLSCSL